MATRRRTILYGTTLLAGFALIADEALARSGTSFAAAAQAKGGTFRPMPSLKGSQSQHFAAARSMLGARASLHLPRITPVKPNFGNTPPQLGLSASVWRGGNGGAGNALPGMLPAYPNYPNKPPQLGVPSRWLNGNQMIPVFPNYANKPQFGVPPSMGRDNGTGAAMPRVLPLAPNYAGAPQPMLAPTWTPAATAVPVLPSLGNRPGLSAPDLGLTPAELKIMALRDKLGLESPDDVQGPGQLPNGLGESSAGRGSGEPPAPQAARDPGCVGPARTLENPQADAANGSTAAWRDAHRQLRERTEHSRAARELLAATRQPGDRNVEHRVRHLPATADRDAVTVVETSWNAADGSRHVVHEEFGVRRRREGSNGFYYSNSTGGPRSAPQTVYYNGEGNELSRVVRKSQEDPTPMIASTDGGNSWELYRDEDNNGTHDGAESQPVDGAAGDRDYFCEAGVTNPDGPGGSRRKPPRARGSDDRNIPDPSGVIIQRDPPPTPEELKRMVTQPGVDGEVPAGGGGGGGRRVSDFAQPPAGGPGGDVSPASPNLPGVGGLPGPIEAPSIPKPSDPERG